MVSPFPANLDRALLNVFLFGSHIGESVAVALPGSGWILIDGCQLELSGETVYPALAAYEQLRSSESDPVELLVWTHPHADHYQGIRECVELNRPRRVGMTMVPSRPAAARELEAIGSHPHLPADLKLQEVFKRVHSTIERISLYWEERPEARLPLSTNSPDLQIGSTKLRFLAPDATALSLFYGLPVEQLRAALKERANEYSIVIMLEYGETKLLLGADLPHSKKKRIIPHGWAKVCAAGPEINSHEVFKVAHHGSWEALPPAFDRREAPPREWLVAPFVTEHLPRPGDDETGGLRQMLQRVDDVRLTSSVGLVSPTEPGMRVARGILRDNLASVIAQKFAGGLRPPVPTSPYDFSWGVAVDDKRAIQNTFAGSQAVTVFEP